MFELQWSAMGDYRDASDTSHNQSNAAGQQEPGRRYVRQRPHTTQSPINDADPEYVTRERYQTLEQSNQPARAHRDMGRATSNPEYMPPIEVTGTAQAPRPSGPAHPMSKPTGKNRPITHSDRYLQTPKPGRSIFTSQYDRRRARNKRLIIAAVIIVIVLAVVLRFVLR